MAENRIFELRNVHFSYSGKHPALCGIDLDIAEGEKIAVIGANGTGKSSLLQLLDGLLFPDKGSCRAFGRALGETVLEDPEFSAFFRKKVGFVFQNPDVQLFCPTVKEDILFGPVQLGIPVREAREKMEALSERLGITALLERAPHELSIGEKRRVALASTLAIDPDVLLLDEPTTGLDPRTSGEIIGIIHESHASGKTVVSSTHDLHVLADISDTVHVFGQDRKIVASGPTKKILEDRALLEQNNLVHAHLHRHGWLWHEHPHPHGI